MEYYINKSDTAILSGRYIDSVGHDSAMYIVKLNPNGNIVWAKKINIPNVSVYFATAIIELDNGDIVLNTLNPSMLNGISIIKLDRNGNLIWTKNIFLPDVLNTNTTDYRLYNFKNSLYMCFMASASFNYGTFSSAIFNLDTAGNILWSKYYNNNDDCTKNSIPIAMTDVNNELIVLGRMIPNTCNNNIVSKTETSYYGMKINKLTGHLIKSVAYRNPIEFGNNLYGLGANTINFFANITKTENDQYYLSGLEVYKANRIKIRFDTSLNLFDGFEYKAANNKVGLGKIDVDLQGKTTIIYTNGYSFQNNEQYIIKLDAFNNVIRQKRLAAPPNTIGYYSGFNPFAKKRNYMSLLTNLQTSTKNYLQLYQLSNDEQNSDCYGTDTSFIQIKPYPFTIDRSPFFDGDYDLPVTVNDVPNIVVSPLNIIEEDVCQQVSSCSFLKIMPTTNFICTPNQTFTAHKNGECYKHVFWQIDTAAIDSIEPIDDTTVFIKFKKTWHGSVYLYASVNSCMDLKDSFQIYGGFVSPESIDLGKDTSICSGNQLYLNAKKGFRNYLWQDGSTDSFFIAKQSGKYFVTATDYCNNFYSDTINITVDTTAAINLGNDTSICSNQSLKLNAGNNLKNFVWNTGDTTSSIIASKAEKYIVNAKDSTGCIATGSISILTIYPAPAISLNKKNIICRDQDDTLFAQSNAFNYLWQDGSADSFFIVKQPGKYIVSTINNYGCANADSTYISAIINAPANFLPADSFVCSGESIIIQSTKNFDQYLWSNGSVGKNISVQQPGVYWLKVIDHDLCVGTDTINIASKNCAATFFVPNSFTPNNDGLNDIFKPIITGELLNYDFSVYNRYGQLVFRTSDLHQGWNGNFNAQQQNSGTFIWYCHYQFKNDTEKFAKGTVVLIR